MPSRHWFLYGRELSGRRPASSQPRLNSRRLAYGAYYRLREYSSYRQFRLVRHLMQNGQYDRALEIMRGNFRRYSPPYSLTDMPGYRPVPNELQVHYVNRAET